MNNNVERIRDALAGGVLGTIVSLVVLLISIVVAAISAANGNEFEILPMWILMAVIGSFLTIGVLAGFIFGVCVTNDKTIRRSVKRWMIKYNC